MAEPLDREGFLAEVARGIDSPTARDEVLAELASHLDDQVADLVAEGVDPLDAERRAIAGMGDARRLGKDLAAARRTLRAALALAGGGALVFAGWSMAGVFIAAVAWWLLGMAHGPLSMVTGDAWANAPGAYGLAATMLVALPWTARLTVAELAGRSPWQGWTLRIGVAALLAVATVPLVLLLPGQQLDGTVVGLFLAVPVVTAVGAVLTPVRAGSTWPGIVALLTLGLVLVLPPIAWPGPVSTSVPWSTVIGNEAAFGRSQDATPAAYHGFGGGGSSGTTETGWAVDWTVDDRLGWTELRLGLWPVIEHGGTWAYADAPKVEVPMRPDGAGATGAIELVSPRQREWVTPVVRGRAPDGVLSVVWLDGPQDLPPWQGSVLDWLLGR